MKNRTRLEKRLLIIIAILLMLLLSGYVLIGGYHVLGIGETIKLACLTNHMSHEYTGTREYNGVVFHTWEDTCWIVTTQ